MPHLKFFNEISKNNVAEAGGKGASLGEMANTGIPVPPGFVVLASAFDRFLEETDLNAEISARLKEVNVADVNSIDKASAVIRDAIHDHAMPKDLEVEILAAHAKLSGDSSSASGLARNDNDFLVAVRSSATAEDSAVASWAGELETYLNTPAEQVVERVKECWSSLFTPRAIFYRHEKNLIDHYVSVAVVVQTMVQSEVSGIAFTVHPVTEDRDQMIIEAGFGLGEAIVGGQITPDSYIVSKSELSILDINVATQTRKLVGKKLVGNALARSAKSDLLVDSGEGKRNEWGNISESEGTKQKLSGKEIIEAAKIFINIEKHYGFPCDIEWAKVGSKFYITQSRPITTLNRTTN
ncbi:MAG: PEP/pyruvate-binding domain-containing protein [Candidatus Magasanikbacteria bacterium]|nr:PEP/pyruvate-binding domain-containing protein [Candidatus Magasanikbacteria bacterium]